jgi:hypothetical protein
VIDLVLDGRVAEATDCLERLEAGWSAATVHDDLSFWIGVVDLVAPSTGYERARLLADLVLRPFGDVVAEVEAPALATTVNLLASARLDDVQAELGDRLTTTDRRLIRAIHGRDESDLRQISSIAHRDAVLVHAARSRRGRIELEGIAKLSTPGSEFPVIARRSSADDEVAVGVLRVAPGDGWRLALHTSRIPTGDWQLVVRVGHDELGPLEVHLTAGRRGPVVPEARWARVVLAPRLQPGDRLVVVARASIAARVLRRLASRLRRA